MKGWRGTIVILLGFVAIIGGAWLILFGATPPCVALGVRLTEAMKNEPPEVQKAAADLPKEMSPVLCAAGAFRLAAGDKSFVKVVKR